MSLPVGGTCPDCIAIDSNTAMLFSDEAPLTKKITPKEGKAVWAFVPDSVQKAKNFTNVAFYFHGHDGWVLVDKAHPGGFTPKWEKDAVTAKSSAVGQPLFPPAPSSNAFNLKPGNGSKHASGPKYELDQPKANDPLVLVPTVALPVAETAVVTVGGIPLSKGGVPVKLPSGADKLTIAKFARDDAGTLTKHGAVLQDLIFDCCEHLRILKRDVPPPPFYLPTSVAVEADRKIDDNKGLQRLFLIGHSGGGIPLGASAGSDLALAKPTDLGLIDCTYAPVPPEYVNFCVTKGKSKLGRGPGMSRMLVFTNVNSGKEDTNKHATELRDELKKQGFSITPLLDVLKPPATWPASIDVAEIQFAVPAANIHAPTAAQLALLEAPLKQPYKVIFIRTNVVHDDMPNTFIPLIFSTSTVP